MSDSFVTSWVVACQVPLFMGFSRPEYWTRLPFSSPGYLPDSGIKSISPVVPALIGDSFIAILNQYIEKDSIPTELYN